MNDDVSGVYLQGGGDTELDADNARFQAAMQQDEADSFYERVKTSVAGAVGIDDRSKGAGRAFDFLMDTPKNIGVGAYRALVNTINTASDLQAEVSPTAIGAKIAGGEKQRQMTVPTLSEEYPELMESLNQISDDWSRNNQIEDHLAEGMTQFALPFMGWLKALGGIKGAGVIATAGKAAAAEGITAGSAFDPHDGRVADLLQMGRELDGRFGEFLRKLSPDGSLVNSYIDYMTNRANEGPWEGRWKNAVDSLVTTAAVAGFLKASGRALRKNRKALDKKAEKKQEKARA